MKIKKKVLEILEKCVRSVCRSKKSEKIIDATQEMVEKLQQYNRRGIEYDFIIREVIGYSENFLNNEITKNEFIELLKEDCKFLREENK